MTDRMAQSAAPRKVTGRAVAIGFVLFFAVVIAVNALMATLAVRSFTGVVVDNGYIASQTFNRWIAKGEAERKTGWTAAATAPSGRPEVIARLSGGGVLTGASITLHLQHPLKATGSLKLALREVSPGRYVADKAIARGQWETNIRIERGGTVVHVRNRLVAEPR